MKCTSKFLFLILTISISVFFCSCGKKENVWMSFDEYSKSQTVDDVTDFSSSANALESFSQKLAVFAGDIQSDKFVLDNATGAVLIDVTNNKPLYSKNAFTRLYPASITKILTALVAIDNCSLDEKIVCTEAVENLGFNDAVALGLKKGDSLTLDQALRLSLISSYNDVSVAIAVHVGGDLSKFAEMMNEKALSLGATGSHFVNPTGLPDDDHYTTVYDLYLIFNEFIKNQTLLEIIQSYDYQTSYTNANDVVITVSATSTNRYFQGYFDTPENMTVVGGKTGTTTEAGYCLLLLTKDTSGNPYISIILQADSTDTLYNEMSEMLKCTQ